MDIGELQDCGVERLEALYQEGEATSVPRGLFRGVYLERVPGARPLVPRVAEVIGFQLTPFWVDFDRRCWAFVHPRLAAGRFTAQVGASRWRDTTTVTMDYSVSRLPGPVRGMLYDEVKPLSDDLCLGFGGINRDRGDGELFFFALRR